MYVRAYIKRGVREKRSHGSLVISAVHLLLNISDRRTAARAASSLNIFSRIRRPDRDRAAIVAPIVSSKRRCNKDNYIRARSTGWRQYRCSITRPRVTQFQSIPCFSFFIHPSSSRLFLSLSLSLVSPSGVIVAKTREERKRDESSNDSRRSTNWFRIPRLKPCFSF